MGSEDQVLNLMRLLDDGIQSAEKIEDKLEFYDSILQVYMGHCTYRTLTWSGLDFLQVNKGDWLVVLVNMICDKVRQSLSSLRCEIHLYTTWVLSFVVLSVDLPFSILSLHLCCQTCFFNLSIFKKCMYLTLVWKIMCLMQYDLIKHLLFTVLLE